MKVIVKDQDGEITTLEAPVLRYGTGDTVDIFIVTEVIKHKDKEDENRTLAMFRNWVTVDVVHEDTKYEVPKERFTSNFHDAV